MKKLLMFGVMVLFLGVAIAPSINAFNFEQEQLPLSKRDTLYVGGSGLGNYTKIQDAIDNASNGDKIFVFNGTYLENPVINKSLQLIGEHRNTTMIKCDSTLDAVHITGHDTCFSDFTLQTNDENLTFFTLRADSIQVSHNNLINITIRSSDHDNIQISNNQFPNDKWVKRKIIFITNARNCVIQGNSVSRTNFAIRIDHGQHSIICYNRVHNAFFGISDVNGKSNVIHNNTIDIAGNGIYINGNNAQVEHNIVFKSNNAIKLYYASNAQITKNDLHDNLIAIDMERSFLNRIISNNFKNSIWWTANIENCLLTRWYHNYWGRPHLLPKIIPTYYSKTFSIFYYITIPAINIDFRPALIPNDIDGST